MKYCARCLYPENARPTIIFDEEGVCSGCRYHESRSKQLDIDWTEREAMLVRILDEAKRMARERGNSHDCIIPVSGGKDSHYQVWLLKEKYGMNPLLVTFNHAFNTPAGNRNLYNLVEKSGCDFVRYTAGLDSVRRISRYMLEKVGDLTWHYHAGIRTYPFQVAVERNIPLIVWGEHGFAELTGIVSLEDFVEFTRWTRKEHDMRGYEPHDLVGHGASRNRISRRTSTPPTKILRGSRCAASTSRTSSLLERKGAGRHRDERVGVRAHRIRTGALLQSSQQDRRPRQ